MIPDELLGIFVKSFQEAAPRSQSNRYLQRPNGEYRILGGSVNITMSVMKISPSIIYESQRKIFNKLFDIFSFITLASDWSNTM